MTSSQFTEDEKIELLEISSYTQAYIAFMESGGADEIQFALQQSLEELGIENARIKGCSVDWRSVWAGSVTSGVIGAGIGFKAGCAGGTVAFPGLGTVTGCVGGTVFGFASGFLYGTIGSIAANLLTTCARGRVAASCGVMMNRGMSLPNTCFNKIDFNFKPGIKFNFIK